MTGREERESAAEDSPLVVELRLLLEAVVDRSEPWLERFTGEGTGGVGSDEPSTCQWCPLCAAAAVVRGERSELASRVGEHAAELLALLREAVESDGATHAAGTHATGSHPAGAGPDTERGGRERRGGRPRPVQHIAVRKAGEPRPAAGDAPPTADEPRQEAGERVQRIEVRRQQPGDGGSGR